MAFHKADGSGDVFIETTRPELLPACVALVAHPDDERYQQLFGSTVRTPLFDVEVPVLAHPLAQHDKGSGIAMICTFGDVTDIVWWRELDLPNRTILGQDGRVLPDAPDVIVTDAGQGRLRRARRQDRVQRQEARRRAAEPTPASSSAIRSRSRMSSSSTRRATARSRSSRRASGTCATAPAMRSCATS